jgi:hypothetical protein
MSRHRKSKDDAQREFDEKASALLGRAGVYPIVGVKPKEMTCRVGVKDEKVLLDFGMALTSLGMTADQARELGLSLYRWANHLDPATSDAAKPQQEDSDEETTGT